MGAPGSAQDTGRDSGGPQAVPEQPWTAPAPGQDQDRDRDRPAGALGRGPIPPGAAAAPNPIYLYAVNSYLLGQGAWGGVQPRQCCPCRARLPPAAIAPSSFPSSSSLPAAGPEETFLRVGAGRALAPLLQGLGRVLGGHSGTKWGCGSSRGSPRAPPGCTRPSPGSSPCSDPGDCRGGSGRGRRDPQDPGPAPRGWPSPRLYLCAVQGTLFVPIVFYNVCRNIH